MELLARLNPPRSRVDRQDALAPNGQRRLGRALVEKGVISEFQLHHALAYQRLDGRQLGDVLIHLRLATEEQIARALMEQQPSLTAHLSAASLAARERELDERASALAALELELRERAQRLFLRESELGLGEPVDPRGSASCGTHEPVRRADRRAAAE